MTDDLTSPRVALVGLGPHARWTYFPALLKAQTPPSLVVELDCNRDAVTKHLSDNHVEAETYFIPVAERDNQRLGYDDNDKLRLLVKELEITHAVITTEPKAHMAYARFFLENGISVLVDKPVSSPAGATHELSAARQIVDDWEELVSLSSDSPDADAYVMAQRRCDDGYRLARRLVQEVVTEYGVPLSFVEVYHGSGTWNLANEFKTREGHPYKYGYGKLLHSGFHFVDLFTWMASCNDVLEAKRPTELELYQRRFRPSDAFFQLGEPEYARLFQPDVAPGLVDQVSEELFAGCGELDSYSLVQLKRDGHVVTTGSLNMLDNSFSRRAWHELPFDTYKGNGRTRHIRMNMQVGPLLNVQIHSYESQKLDETKRNDGDPQAVGGWDHFDIHVFRNSDLIGGTPFELIRGTEVGRRSGTAADDYKGHNREAREMCVRDFLHGTPSAIHVSEFERSHRLLSLLHECSVLESRGELPVRSAPW